ncbi:ABC transporter permease [Brachybacterium sp. AOP43-C2-M15]|uniref:ABC transporter permease n=1 Tax=Brachybacterium sp. AOP43-C2-M15 TaxID=3457661 RepID=UPI0040338DF0
MSAQTAAAPSRQGFLGLLLERREILLVTVVIATVVLFAIANPSFLSLAHLFGLGRSTVYLGLMALGVMLVLLTGGIDISVSAIAVSSMYLTTVTLIAFDYQGTFLLAVALAVAIGAVLGLVNGILVTWLKLPSLIVTIGTLTLYRGALLAFVGTERFRTLPAQMAEFSGFAVFRTSDGGRLVALHGAVLILVVLAVVLALALSRTWWGRYIYAIGDNQGAAERMGVPVARIRITAFVLSGALAGLAGLFYAAMSRTADPASLNGVEMMVLAAVVLGGTAVTGGRGSVLGTLLGVLLITIVGSSLVLVGIPTAWQQLFIGLFVLFGVGIPALRERRNERRRGMVVSE